MGGMEVSWKWINQKQGEIKWTITNTSSQAQSVLLLRGGRNNSGLNTPPYYFGNSYWPVYIEEGLAQWKTGNTAYPIKTFIWYTFPPITSILPGKPELAIINLEGKYLVALVFSVAPYSSWPVQEGGFIDGVEPYGVQLVPVQYQGTKCFSVGYQPQQVTAFNQQAGTNLEGYKPNPNTFKISLYSGEGPYISVYNDTIKEVECQESSQQGILQEAWNDIIKWGTSII